MTIDEEMRVRELLAPLDRLEPPKLRAGKRRRSSHLLVGAAVVAALAITGVAIAASFGTFDGIGAAQHPQEASDLFDPETAAFVQHADPPVLPETARLVGSLPSGRRFWVVQNTRGELCEVVEDEMMGCGSALSEQKPITVATMDRDGPGGEPPVSFGVALDGVTAVSFPTPDGPVTVPVTNNVWAYEGASSVLESAVVHYADGTTTTISH